MTTLWIGDFRCRQIQHYHENVNITNNIYLLEDTGEYSWFNSSLLEQLPQLALEEATVIVMLGFNDCVYSCVWDAFNIKNIADGYAKVINNLVEQYPNIKFYISSVNPIDADYPFAESFDSVIKQEILTNKIKQFNDTIKKKCIVPFIDTYGYLTSTSFYTHDGVLFGLDTIASLNSYISLSTDIVAAGSDFISRLSAPVVDASISGEYWLGDNYGGSNPFDNLGQSNAKIEGDTLPNCTAYAWGRFYEISGSMPKLYLGKVEQWYDYEDDGYTRGQEPALGAVMCWKGTNAADTDGKNGRGHVAIVEKINDDGSIITSESSWSSSKYWWTTERKKGSDGRWGQSSAYIFQGFIYNPKISTGDFIDKSQVISKNSYLSRSEMEINARYIWSYLGSKGWTLNAVAGILGNMQTESSITPNRCEVSSIVSGPSGEHPTAADIEAYANSYLKAHNRFPGYGLVQWTGQRSASAPNTWDNQKYIYWCTQNNLDPADIDSQLERIIWECDNGVQFYSTSDYPITFKEFSTSTLSAEYLAKAFLKNYERPLHPDYETRGKQGKEWYDFLLSYAPSAPPTIILENLKIDRIAQNEVEASFITKNVKTVDYTLLSDNQIAENGQLDLVENNSNNLLTVTSFNCTNLTPNVSYELIISCQDNLLKTAYFNTLQSCPEQINSIEIKPNSNTLLSDSFKLVVTPSKTKLNWGYWKNNGNGYTIQLIVNGKVKKEKEVNMLPKTFKINDYFSYNNITVGDTIQIGIRTWTKYDGKKLYDSDFAKCSNPICMLKKPVVVYLNK